MQTVRNALAGAALAGAALLSIALSSCGNQSKMESPGTRTPSSRPSWDEEDEWGGENGTIRSSKTASQKRSRTGSGFRGREYVAAAEDENGETAEAETPRWSSTGTAKSQQKKAKSKKTASSVEAEEDSLPPLASARPSRSGDEESGETGEAPTAATKKAGAESKTGAAGSGTASKSAAASKTGAARKPAAGKSAASKSGKGAGKSEDSPAEPTEAEMSVAVIVQQLQDPLMASVAFRRIWEAPRSIIPELIRQVENDTPSRIERLQVLVLDPDFEAEPREFMANRIRGLGKLEEIEGAMEHNLNVVQQGYDKMYYGKRDGHYRVVLEQHGGFPVGVVIRAGLLNRLQSSRYPAASDDDVTPGKLIEWWREYYELAGAGAESESDSGANANDG